MSLLRISVRWLAFLAVFLLVLPSVDPLRIVVGSLVASIITEVDWSDWWFLKKDEDHTSMAMLADAIVARINSGK